MDRRAFLEGGAVAALGGLAPFLAAADRGGWTDAHVAAFLERLEDRRARARARTARIRARLREGRDGSRTPAEHAVEELLPAILGVNVALSAPVRVQVHPDVQRSLRRDLATVGEQSAVLAEALRAARAGADTLAADPGLRDDALAVVAAELGGDDLPSPVADRLARGLGRLGWDLRRRPLGAVIDEHLAAYDRLAALVDDPDAAARALRVDDPETRAALADLDAGPEADPSPPTAQVIAGALVLGLGIASGLVVAGLGVATIWCPCVGVPLLVVGALMIYASWTGGRRLLGVGPTFLTLTATQGWVRSQLDAGAYDPDAHHVVPRYYVHVRWRERGDRALQGALLEPGFPAWAVLARIGDDVWPVPEDGVLVVSRLGQPAFAINAPEGAVFGKVSLRFERLDRTD